MLSLQINTAFSFASGLGAPDALSRSVATPSDSENLQSAQRGGETPSNAVRPGSPVSNLDFRTQNQSQDAFGEAETENAEADQALAEPGERTNENGEKVDEAGLTEAEQQEVEKLKSRDREVRAHERAHATTGGGTTGQPQFTFTTGPDGKQYAVGGEVSIDASPVSGNPEATIRKMELVKRAALAPSNPSGQDRKVAAEAEAKIQAARQEITEEKRTEQAEQAEKRAERQNGEPNEIGQSEPSFNPEARFKPAFGGAGIPLGTGLAGQGELSSDTGTLSAGELFNLIA